MVDWKLSTGVPQGREEKRREEKRREEKEEGREGDLIKECGRR